MSVSRDEHASTLLLYVKILLYFYFVFHHLFYETCTQYLILLVGSMFPQRARLGIIGDWLGKGTYHPSSPKVPIERLLGQLWEIMSV